MKPTVKQQDFIKELLIELTYWKTTNDINSPTHYSDLKDDCEKWEEEYGIKKDVVYSAMLRILNEIKDIK